MTSQKKQKNISFVFAGQRGFIELHPAFHGGAFIQFGGNGFHRDAVRGDLKAAVDAILAKARD